MRTGQTLSVTQTLGEVSILLTENMLSPGVVNLHCQCDWIWNHRGHLFLSVSMIAIQEMFKLRKREDLLWMRAVPSHGRVLVWIKRRKKGQRNGSMLKTVHCSWFPTVISVGWQPVTSALSGGEGRSDALYWPPWAIAFMCTFSYPDTHEYR